MKSVKITGIRILICAVFFFSVLISISFILPVHKVNAGWMDNVIREGTDAIIDSTVPDTDEGARVKRTCSNAFYLRSWERIACTFGGTLVDKLSEEDQKELAESTEETIATGQDSGWSNPDTGVEGEVKVTGTKINRKRSEVTVEEKVQEVPPLDLIAGEFTSVTETNIFAGPGANFRSTGYLTKGQIVEVIAKVQNQAWYLVSQDGIGSGYVDSNSLKPTGRIKTTTQGPTTKSQPKKRVRSINVDTKQECKTVEQKVTFKDGSTQKNLVEACPEPDGTWDVA